MPIAPPFAAVDRRTAWLRGILLSSCLLGLLSSVPVWLNARACPLVPMAKWFPILPAPWDKLLFGAMLLALVVAPWCYRVAVGFFLCAALFVFGEDQTRGQPWFYMYWVMLLLTLLPASASACRCALSAVYLWSGIQKLNPRFFHGVPEWFVAPAEHWPLPPGGLALLHGAVTFAPFVELGIGLALWSPRLRRPAIGATILTHSFALLFLGPLGYNYNCVVWPWNLAIVALVCALFAEGATKSTPAQTLARSDKLKKKVPTIPRDASFAQAFAELRQCKIAFVIVALFTFLPVLSYSGWWDSYFSFSLYAQSRADANVFVTKAFADRLPPALRAQVKPFQSNYDPVHQGPYLFLFEAWAYEQLRVPPIPEPRCFEVYYRFLRRWSKEPGDLRMIVGPRAGPVIFYEGNSRTFLAPKP